ncbi:hypothetical protein BOX15_Mlig009797g1, partial [Macrostomum lignano]
QSRWPRQLFDAEDAADENSHHHYWQGGAATATANAADETATFGNIISQDTMAIFKGRGLVNNPLANSSLASISFTNNNSAVLQQQSMAPTVTAATAAVHEIQDEAQLAAGENLFADFHQVIGEYDGLELCRRLADLCSDQDALLRRLGLRLGSQQRRAIGWECQTWRLLALLYRDRMTANNSAEDAMDDRDTEVDDGIDEPMVEDADQSDSDGGYHWSQRHPEKRLVAHLYATDAEVREFQLLIDWLEAAAASRLDELPSPPDACEAAAAGGVPWEHTLHLLRRSAASVPAGLVNRLDPDGPIAAAAQRKQFSLQHQQQEQQQHSLQLADLDRAAEDRLLAAGFQLLRAGQLQRAGRLFSSAGQHWRAACLYGWQLPSNGNPYGNPRRDLWRAAAWSASSDCCMSRWERAIFAALCGSLDPLLAVFPPSAWEDRLWAHARCFVEARVSDCLGAATTTGSTCPELTGPAAAAASVAKRLTSRETVMGRLECRELWPSVQTALILDRPGTLPAMLAGRLADGELDSQELRFAVHLALCLQRLGLLGPDEPNSVKLLHSFIDGLIEEGRTDLVAYYTARLPRDEQVGWYGKLLQRIEDTSARVHCLQLAERAGLDTAAITVSVVESVRRADLDTADCGANSNAALAGASEQLTEADRRKINALDWVILAGATPRIEAVRQACALARLFLALNKEQGARDALAKVPDDSLKLVEAQEGGGSDGGGVPGSLPPVASDAMRELAGLKAYLVAQEAVADWTVHFYQARPERPEPAPAGAPYTEKLFYEQRERRYQAELERWRHLLSLHTRAAMSRLEDLLLWPAPGWLADQFTDQSEAAEPGRTAQLQSLRRLYLPQLCLCVARLLLQAEQPSFLTRLAELIAAESPGRVGVLFRQDQLQQLFMLIRDAACRLLDDGFDAFGYDMSTTGEQ